MAGGRHGLPRVPAVHVREEPTLTELDRTPRRYDNTLRQQLAAETRERIIAAGSAILHRAPVRSWQGLTVRAVAEYPNNRAPRQTGFSDPDQQQCVGIGQSLRRLHHRHPMADPHVGLTEGPIDLHR